MQKVEKGMVGHFRMVSMSAAAVVIATAVGCSSENPQIAMCQSITKNLVTGFDSFSSSSVDTKGNTMTVSASYDGGTVTCDYSRQQASRDDDSGVFNTAPERVTLNGEVLTGAALLNAGVKASKEQLQAVADETAAQSKALAADAKVKAGELAEQASAAASEASEAAAELANQASDVAKGVGERAKETALEAAEKVQQELQQQLQQ